MRRVTMLGLGILIGLALAPPVGAVEPPGHDLGRDEVIQVRPDPGGVTLQATDPLGLQPFLDIVRKDSLGTDVIDVWACDAGATVGSIVSQLDATVVPYIASHSRGRLTVDFVARGTSSGDAYDCLQAAADGASGNANGAMIVTNGSGGNGGPGWMPPSDDEWPGNNRYAIVGLAYAFPMVATHELGHTYSWPHVDTVTNGDVYDNALDVMSGNNALDGSTAELPYGTAAMNRYAAGWMDVGQVRIVTGAPATFRLEPSTGAGTQMAVIRDGARFITLGARTTSAYDPIPSAWQGVEVHEVTPCPSTDLFTCFDLANGAYQMGFRDVAPYGRVPYDWGDPTLAHVISAGSDKLVLGRTIDVAAASGGAYTVTISEGSGPWFTDTGGHTFEADIEWLAAEGITKGCTSTNERFCPNDPVTRGQMAAFLHRALPDLPTGAAIEFVDDDGSTFEADIEWLSSTGVTKGCSPPPGAKFCPAAVVTRAQMAAFLHRALPDLPTGAPLEFTDDDGLSYEADIEWLAATGITKGCNPPTNDRFCPGAPVTRGAMAAFLHRALGD